MSSFDKDYVMTNVDYWLWLSLKRNMSAAKMQTLIQVLGLPKTIFNMSAKQLASVKGLGRRTVAALSDKSLERVMEVKKECSSYGIKIITYDSPYYPENLRNISAPPYVLYIRSAKNNINLNEYIRVAMVGNRKFTEYGETVAKQFAYDLASNGIVVVSGMAEGVDTASHRGAIEAGGITVAVMGCGLHMAYPHGNTTLMDKIVETGMAISEYPPGVGPDKWHFPERNRIISGLSLGTLVVEAPERSGSLITANYAIDQDRALFAIPGDITKERSAGTNNLLKEYAYPVTSARDIFEYYSFEFSEVAKIKKLQKEKGIVPDGEYKETVKKETVTKINLNDEKYKDLTDEEKHIITKLSDNPVSFEKLLALTDIPADKLTSMITMLEIKGKIKTHPGKNFTLNT